MERISNQIDNERIEKMKALQFFVIATMLASFALVTAASADYYVVRNQHGSSAVVDGLPGYGWSITFGPYASVDAAQRAMGTGTNRLPDGLSGDPAPAVPRAGWAYNPDNVGF